MDDVCVYSYKFNKFLLFWKSLLWNESYIVKDRGGGQTLKQHPDVHLWFIDCLYQFESYWVRKRTCSGMLFSDFPSTQARVEFFIDHAVKLQFYEWNTRTNFNSKWKMKLSSRGKAECSRLGSFSRVSKPIPIRWPSIESFWLSGKPRDVFVKISRPGDEFTCLFSCSVRREKENRRKNVNRSPKQQCFGLVLCGFVWSECEQRYAPTSKEKCRHNQFSYYYFFCVKCVIIIFILLFSFRSFFSSFFIIIAAAVEADVIFVVVATMWKEEREKSAQRVSFEDFFLFRDLFFLHEQRCWGGWKREQENEGACGLNGHWDEVRCAIRIEKEIYYPICKRKKNKNEQERMMKIRRDEMRVKFRLWSTNEQSNRRSRRRMLIISTYTPNVLPTHRRKAL